MPQFITRSANLMPRPAADATGFAASYSFDGEAAGHLDLGNLLVVAEVQTPLGAGQNLVDLIIHTFGDQYYNQNQELTPAQRFEAATRVLNTELQDYRRQDDSWQGKLHAVVAVLAADGMHITSTGQAEALLVRRGQGIPVTSEPDPKHGKDFPSVSSGQLKEGDKILLITASLISRLDTGELTGMISRLNPNRTVSELSAMVGRQHSHLAAAIVAEVTTPEKMTMMPLPSEPGIALAGPAPTFFDKAKSTAGPAGAKLAKGLKKSGLTAGRVARDRLLPGLRQGGLKLAGFLRRVMRERRSRPKLWAGIAAVILLVALFLLKAGSDRTSARLAEQFNQAVATYQSAEQAYLDGNKAGATQKLAAAQRQLDQLRKSRSAGRLNSQLHAKAHPEGQPGNLDELAAAIGTLADSIEGLVRLTPATVVDFATAKVSPNLVEKAGDQIIAVTNDAVLTVTGSQAKTAASAKFGQVLATAAADDAVYILTAEPAVWKFNLADNSLAKQELNAGSWPQAKALAVYNGNLYLLTGGQVKKYVPTLAGFAFAADYLADQDSGDAYGATAIGIDGSVYLGGGTKVLARYFAGRYQQTAASLPSAFSRPSVIRAYGDQLIMVAGQRFALVATSEDVLAFIRQFEFKNLAGLKDAVYDPDSKTVYALAGNKLVKAQVTF